MLLIGTLLVESRMFLSRVFPLFFSAFHRNDFRFVGQGDWSSTRVKSFASTFPSDSIRHNSSIMHCSYCYSTSKKVAQLVAKTLSPTVQNFTPNFSTLPADGRHWKDTELICSLYPSAAVTLPLGVVWRHTRELTVSPLSNDQNRN